MGDDWWWEDSGALCGCDCEEGKEGSSEKKARQIGGK